MAVATAMTTAVMTGDAHMDDYQNPPDSKRFSKRAVFILAAAIVVFAAGLYWYVASRDFAEVTNEEKNKVGEIAALTRQGSYEESLAHYRAILNDAAYDKNTKARATVAATHSRLRGVDNLDEAIQHIRDLKAIVADTSIEPKTRAEAIYFLGAAYDIDGLNKALYKEVYSTEPYASMRSDISRSASAGRVHEWSYSVYPLARSALGIALSNMRGVFRDRYGEIQDPEQSGPDQLLARAEEYLKNAEMLMSQEREDRRFVPEVSDVYYRYWHTFLTGALGHFKGGEYATKYRTEYEALIRDFERGEDQNQEMSQYLNFAYWNYASMLVLIDNDRDAAKAQLDKLMPHVQNDPHYNVNQFVMVMKKYSADAQADFNSYSIQFLGELSPAFKQFVETIQKS